jgi:hypothetical protein
MGTGIRRSILPKTLLLAAIVTPFFVGAEPAGAASTGVAAQTQIAQAKEYPYYVEFRVALDGVYGHSYIAYGRLDSVGRPATAAYADIHPTGDLPSMVLGHFLPMDAATVPEKDTLGYRIARRFRRPLTAAEYGRLTAAISHIRAAGHSWNVLAYNCNDFVADVARAMGMQTPATLSLPYDFIPTLQAINASAQRHVSAQLPARVAEIRPSVAPRGGVIEPRIHLSQAAILSRQAGPPLFGKDPPPQTPECQVER